MRIVSESLAFGIAPAPLSAFYGRSSSVQSGLLLGIATVPQRNLARYCDRLLEVIERFT